MLFSNRQEKQSEYGSEFPLKTSNNCRKWLTALWTDSEWPQEEQARRENQVKHIFHGEEESRKCSGSLSLGKEGCKIILKDAYPYTLEIFPYPFDAMINQPHRWYPTVLHLVKCPNKCCMAKPHAQCFALTAAQFTNGQMFGSDHF